MTHPSVGLLPPSSPVCQYSVFDLTDPSAILIHVASTCTLDAVVLLASSLPEAVTALTAFNGRMDPLPDWVGDGAIVGLQGGTEQVRPARQIGRRLGGIGSEGGGGGSEGKRS